MRVNRIIKRTFAEGPGRRFCIWVQGCNHRCDGCFARALWSFDGGYDVTADDIISMIKSVEDDICGVTFLGGEPFEYARELAVIADYIHSVDKNVICFTGYGYEFLLNDSRFLPLINKTDLLIDGEFKRDLLDYSRPLAGSSNQRFIYLTDRITKEQIENYKNRFEIRVSPDGKVQINGMGNIQKLNILLSSKKEKL